MSDRPSRREVPQTQAGSEWRWLPHLVLACSVALLAPLLGPLVTGRVFVYNDLIWFHLPLRYLFQEALRAGDTVLWTPSIFAGFYLHGEGQAGLFHPLHQVLYRGLPLGAAFNLELVASYPFAFAGMWWLLRRLAIGQAAALFGAMLFAFCGFNLLHHHHMNMVAAAAHLPWMLAAADVVIGDERPRARRFAFAGLAATVGSALLLGFPQSVWWCFLALVPFAAFRAATTRRWSRLVPCALAVACGILLAGVQLLPSLDAAAGSTRAGLPADFALTFSLHPSNLIQLWSPYFFARGAHSTRDYMWFHEFGIYSGAILPVALAWTWSRWRAVPERRALLAAATGFAVLCLWLALGRYGGLAALLTHVPAIGSLRAPVRYVFLVQFALAIVAALAFDDLLDIVAGRREAPAGRMPALWIPAALGVATTAALNSHLLPFGAHTFAGVAVAAPGVAILVAVTGLVCLARRRWRWALPALVVVVAADLGAYGLGFIRREPARTIADLTSAIPPAPDAVADAYAAAPGRGPYQANLLVLPGYRLTSGYAGLFPQSRHPLDGRGTRILTGTRWIFDADGHRQPFEGAVPRARLMDPDGSPATGTVVVTVDRPGHLVARVDAPGPRLLAFTERFHAGWSTTSGAAAVTVTPVEGDFLGCQLGPGTHEVDLTFMPRSFAYGSMVSAGGALLLVAALVIWPWRQRASE